LENTLAFANKTVSQNFRANEALWRLPRAEVSTAMLDEFDADLPVTVRRPHQDQFAHRNGVDGASQVCQVLPQVLTVPGKMSTPCYVMSGATSWLETISYACGAVFFLGRVDFGACRF
jgi:hypothetical protein